MRIVIITNMPSPYRVPLFNALNTECRAKGWILKIIFITRSYTRRHWDVIENDFEFDYVYLRDRKFVFGEALFSFSFSLFQRLMLESPDIIITGGFSVSTLWANLYGRLFKKPYIVWTGETIDENKLRKKFRPIRSMVRSFLMRQAHGFVVYGSAAKKYLVTSRVPEFKIFVARNTVDTEFYMKESARVRLRRNDYINNHKLPAGLNILYIGQLEKRKGVDLMLNAIRRLQEKKSALNFATHIIGSGSCENELQSLVSEARIRNVYFWGFKQKMEIAEFLGVSDLLVFPSMSELYGLVPIEAMACGVPVICSSRAGVTEDLITDGANGLLVDPANEVDLCSRIEQLIENKDLRLRLGTAAGKTIMENFLIKHSIKGFIDAIQFTVKTIESLR